MITYLKSSTLSAITQNFGTIIKPFFIINQLQTTKPYHPATAKWQKHLPRKLYSLILTSQLKTDLQLHELTFDEEEVSNHLVNLDVTKASRPDGIPTRLLKECRQQIAPSLCGLFMQHLFPIWLYSRRVEIGRCGPNTQSKAVEADSRIRSNESDRKIYSSLQLFL